jgi:hypothetical protein
MALYHCRECGHEISSKAKQCPNCGFKRNRFGFVKIMGTAVGGLLVLGIVAAIVGGTDKTAPSKTADSVASQISIAREQSLFVNTVDAFIPRYEAAPNELKKSELRKLRANAIAQLTSTTLRGTQINNWIGTVQKMGTNTDGKAHITIMLLNSKTAVATWNNALSDQGANTLIPMDSSVYQKLSEMVKGDMVVFSGLFFSDSADSLQEKSITEHGSMTSPEFLVRLSDISKYDAAADTSAPAVSSTPRRPEPHPVVAPPPGHRPSLRRLLFPLPSHIL